MTKLEMTHIICKECATEALVKVEDWAYIFCPFCQKVVEPNALATVEFTLITEPRYT